MRRARRYLCRIIIIIITLFDTIGILNDDDDDVHLYNYYYFTLYINTYQIIVIVFFRLARRISLRNKTVR